MNKRIAIAFLAGSINALGLMLVFHGVVNGGAIAPPALTVSVGALMSLLGWIGLFW